MVIGLLDTNILVDILRLYQPAVNWLSNGGELGVSAVVWLELIQGAENGHDQRKALKLLEHFERFEPDAADFRWAIGQLTKFSLSHNVSGVDCLIAATPYRMQLPLYTQNLKHLAPLLGKLAQKPY